jgi:hypothetical protein
LIETGESFSGACGDKYCVIGVPRLLGKRGLSDVVGCDAVGVLAFIHDAARLLFVERYVVKHVTAFASMLNVVIRKFFPKRSNKNRFIGKANLLRGGVLLKHFLLFF